MSLPNRFNYMYRTAILEYMQDDNDLQSKQQLAECSFPLFATNWSHDNFNSKLPSKLLNPTANREARKQKKLGDYTQRLLIWFQLDSVGL